MSETRISYSGSLDMASVQSFSTTIEAAAKDHQHVLLDLSGLEFIDSTGVRTLINVKERLNGERCKLTVFGLKPDIMDILEILGIRELVVGE